MPRFFLEESSGNEFVPGKWSRGIFDHHLKGESSRRNLHVAQTDDTTEAQLLRRHTRGAFSSFLGGKEAEQLSEDLMASTADLDKLLNDMRAADGGKFLHTGHLPGAAASEVMMDTPDAKATIDSPDELQVTAPEEMGPAGGFTLTAPGAIPTALPASDDATKLMEYWTFTDQYGDGGAGNHAVEHGAHHSTSSHMKHVDHQLHHRHHVRHQDQPPVETSEQRPPANASEDPVGTVIMEEEQDNGFHPVAVLGGMMAVFGQVYCWASVFVTLFKRQRPAFGEPVSGNAPPRQQATTYQSTGYAGADQAVDSFSGASGQASSQMARDAPVTAAA